VRGVKSLQTSMHGGYSNSKYSNEVLIMHLFLIKHEISHATFYQLEGGKYALNLIMK
jgi:hypothetical protein